MSVRVISLTFASLALVGLGACASAGSRDANLAAAADARLAEYTATGETMSCLNTTRIDQIRPLDDTRWLVTARGGETYLNEVSRGCNHAASGFTYLTYEAPGGQLCRGQIVRVIDRTADQLTGSCGLGEYQRLVPVDD